MHDSLAMLIDLDDETLIKVQAVKVTITRAEGITELCGTPHVFEGPTCWSDANAWLRSQAHTFPACGAYDKHDFVVEFDDGNIYDGRLDCKQPQFDNSDLDIAQHILRHQRFMAGELRPSWMSDAQWAQAQRIYAKHRDAAKSFLASYQVGDA